MDSGCGGDAGFYRNEYQPGDCDFHFCSVGDNCELRFQQAFCVSEKSELKAVGRPWRKTKVRGG